MTETLVVQSPCQSRAVLLRTTKVGRRPGPCHYCGQKDWNMGSNLRQPSHKGPRTVLIINVFEDGEFVGLLWACRPCYVKAGDPYGPVLRRDGAGYVRGG